MARGGAAEHERRRQIDGDDIVPLLVFHHHEQIVFGQPGIVDQNIETAAQRLDCFVNQFRDGGAVGQIARHDDDALAEFFRQCIQRIDLAARNRNRGTVLMQHAGDLGPKPAARAGDQRRLACQIEHSFLLRRVTR